MTDIALFHSVLGVRPGIHACADLLRSHGHTVHIVDQYDGRVFDDYEEAAAFAEGLGYPALMGGAVEATHGIPEGFVCVGFSNGGGMAQFVAASRRGVLGAALLSGAIDPAELGLTAWPSDVPVQIHYTEGDPFRRQVWLDAAVAAVRAAGADVEQFDYPGSGHLFTDASLPAEYQPEEAEQMWPRVLDFIARARMRTTSREGTGQPVLEPKLHAARADERSGDYDEQEPTRTVPGLKADTDGTAGS